MEFGSCDVAGEKEVSSLAEIPFHPCPTKSAAGHDRASTGTAGVRSALIVYSPSSQGKENLLRRPDEWGPLFFRALQEQNHRKLNVAMVALAPWEAGLPRLQAGKGKAPASKDSSL